MTSSLNPLALRRTLGQFRPQRLFYRAFPQRFWQPYQQQAKAQGIHALYFVLSFDCDTDHDARAALQVNQWLSEHGIKATYAVPGIQLQNNAAIYQQIASTGQEFINHGALPHMAWQVERFISVTFYNEMTPTAVEQDIRQGHDILREVLGQEAIGFRAPHFGYIAQAPHLERVHQIIKQMNYRYSTSTLPLEAYKHGPLWSTQGLLEIPLSGSYYDPFTLLDSWSHRKSPTDTTLSKSYCHTFIRTIDALLATSTVGILNYYVDPAHVFQSAHFFLALEHLINHNIQSLHYRDLLQIRG